MWRLWLRNGTSLEEIDRSWSMADVLDANEALDIRDAIQALTTPDPAPVPGELDGHAALAAAFGPGAAAR